MGLLARGVPSGNVEQLLRGLWLITAELMHQGSVVCAGPEHGDDVGIADLGKLVTLSRESPNVIPQKFALLLTATLEILGVARSHVCALKVSSGDPLEILPAIN
jgi:hypothetical protein